MKHPLFAGLLFPLMATVCASVFAQTPPTPAPETAKQASVADEGTPAKAESVKLAFILPRKKSRFDAVTQYALDGVLAANYASPNPAHVLLIRPGADDNVANQLKAAANAGALAAIGPLDRNAIEQIAKMDYLPLPVVTLNQVELDTAIPLTPEEIQARQMQEEARRIADAAARELNATTLAQQEALSEGNPALEGALNPESSGSIASDLKIPGLVLAKDIAPENVRYEPRLFPRGLLMTGLSLEADAAYVADLGIQELPRLTETGERPKVLVLDQNKPLQKRISAAFCQKLTELGFAPDRLTIDLKDLQRITQFFELVVEDDDPEIEPEEPIDQEVDPLGWRQQQLRQTRESAERRAQAALAEPPYYAVFMALDASTASQIRPRLPLRTRLWGTSLLYPGNPETDSSAKALTYDLKQVGFVDSPFILTYNDEAFEATYHVPPPAGLVAKQLFALGVDALSIANSIARGQTAGELAGLTGSLSFNLDLSPVVTRHGACAMIANGSIRMLSPEELIDFHVIDPVSRLAKPKAKVKKPAPQAPAQDAPEQTEKAADTPAAP